MSDGKIRVLILAVCIGGSVLAGITSPDQNPDTLGTLPNRSSHSLKLLKESAGTVFRRAQNPSGSAESTALQRAASEVKEQTAPARLDSSGQGPSNAVEEPSPVSSAPRYRGKTQEETKVEQLIETAFRKYFKTYRIAGKSLSLRMPFGLNYEREGSRGYSQVFYLDGKGTPEQLWLYIDSVLASEQFSAYAEALGGPGDKLIVFELERRSYSLSRDQTLLESLRGDSYPGTPTRILVRRNSAEITGADVYNYLYAVASVGVDCSGFTFYIHDSIAQAYGLEISRMLGQRWQLPPEQVGRRVGLWFYDPASGYSETVPDRIENLRPADVILFRGSDGELKHSAVIQSIDWEKGLIRYVQCTDWAIESERGVHQSVIRFDPSRPQVSLKHYSVIWMQQVRPPFDGELEPRDWLTDRERYMWYPTAGGSLVVRLRYLAEIFQNRESRFYANTDEAQESSFGEKNAGSAVQGAE
jgi:cell wall-associated NlpC family hydrolase